MRTPAEYESEIDRLSSALDLEAKARASMAEAFARATNDLKAAEEKLKARDAFIMRVKESMDWYTPDNIFLLINGGGVTIQQAITALLDDPKARGEQPLLDIDGGHLC